MIGERTVRRLLGHGILAVWITLAPSLSRGQESVERRPVREPGAGLLFYEGYTLRDAAEAAQNPYVIGALFQLYWSEIEKENGVYDWSAWDRRIQPWFDAGKKVAFRFMWSTSGNWPHPAAKRPTPQWVWEEGAKFSYYEFSDTEIPLIWDPIYQKFAKRFMEETSRKYAGNENVLFFDVTPGAETNPYRARVFNQMDPTFRDRFNSTPASDGRTYAGDMWTETVKQFIDMSAEAIPNAPLLVTPNGGHFSEIARHCVDQRLYVGQNGINGRSHAQDSARRREYAEWSTFTKLFFEMVDPVGVTLGEQLREWGRPVPDDESYNRITIDSLMGVMEAAERINCSYLAVYGQDVLKGTIGHDLYDPEFEAALRYGAEMMKKPRIIPSGDEAASAQPVFTYEQSRELRRLAALHWQSQKSNGRNHRIVH